MSNKDNVDYYFFCIEMKTVIQHSFICDGGVEVVRERLRRGERLRGKLTRGGWKNGTLRRGGQ